METLFTTCAVVGGTVLVCQFLLTLLGMGEHHDLGADASADGFDFHGDIAHTMSVGHDVHAGDSAGHHAGSSSPNGHQNSSHGGTSFFRIITFRTVVAAIAFFGLAGMTATSTGAEPVNAILIATCAGAGAMLAVHWGMQQLSELRTDGTVRMHEALGQVGTVYLTIRGHNQGAGKIQLTLRDRTAEFEARTREDDIPTGTQVVVVGLLGAETVEVERIPKPEELSHV